MDWLETAVKMSIVAGFIGSVISFAINAVVLKPLETTLARLQETVEKLSEQLAKTEERWHDVDKKVAQIEQSTRSAHRRLDEHLELCHGMGGVSHERLEHR